MPPALLLLLQLQLLPLALLSSASTRSVARLCRKRYLHSFTSSLPHFPTPPLIRSSIPPSFFFPISLAPPPIRNPVFPRSPPCDTPLHSSAHSFLPPFFLLPLFFGSSAHSGPRFPAFPAARHSHPPLHLHFPAPPLIRSSPPPPFFSSSSFPSSLRPFATPFSRVPHRATLPFAPLRQALTGNRERSRQPHRRSSRTKKSDPLGPDTIGYQSVFQKKGDYISRIRMLSPNIIKAVRTH